MVFIKDKSKGIQFMMIATFAFAFMNLLVKELSSFHPMQVAFFRAFGTFSLILPYMIIKRIPIKGILVKPMLWRGIAGMVSISTFFLVVQRIPLGSAISLRYLAPLIAAFLALFILKERISLMQWIGFGIAFLGVILMKGFDLRIDFVSLGLILISAFAVAIVFILLRYIGPKEHPLTIINYFMVITILASLFFIREWRMPINAEWYSVITIGVFGLIGQIFMTKAFQVSEASTVAPFKYMELVYAIVLAYFFYDESYQLLPLIGIVLIVAGMVLSVLGKR